MTTTLFGITWTYTYLIIYLGLFLTAVGIIVWRYRAHKQIIRLLSSHSHHKILLKNYSQSSFFIKPILYGTGLFFIFLTLLHPQWNKKEEAVMQEGRDLFIALDISRSMLAQDVKPNRLQCARQKIKKLLSLLSCERVGLMLFSGAPFVQCPLTTDYGAFHMFLDTIDAETVSSGTTALDAAINKALTIFSSMPNKKNKLLVILTDGEDFSSSLADVKQKAKDIGLHIFTIGIGTTQGAPIPVFDEQGNHKGMQRDEKGSIVISRLNEGILRTLSQDTGAHYIKATSDDHDLELLLEAVQRYEKEKFEDKKFARYEEQYPYFLFMSLLCFALEWIL